MRPGGSGWEVGRNEEGSRRVTRQHVSANALERWQDHLGIFTAFRCERASGSYDVDVEESMGEPRDLE